MLLLAGCAKPDPIQTATETVKNSVQELQKKLTPECATDVVLAQIDVINAQIDTIATTCADQIDQVTDQRNRWRTIALVSMFVISLFLIAKIL